MINIRTIHEGKEKRKITEDFPWIKKIEMSGAAARTGSCKEKENQ